MANNQIGTAYLMVVPELKGDFSKDLKAGITAGAQGAGRQAGQEAGDGISAGLLAKSVAIGNIISNAITAGAKAGADALVSIVEDAFSGFSRYEQLSGGIEKLYGEDALVVLENARHAFETTSLSANRYLENVSTLSAALLNATGGDAQRAAEVANMAITDMMDNYNTFGMDLTRLEATYSGLARQSYMTLDNLSLGYGQSRAEMERLLADAEALSGVHYDIDNLADVYTAIHIIQTEVGITGKTAEEALTTVEGSVLALKSAWENWLTELGKPNADMSAVTDALIESLGAAAANVVPAVQRIAFNLASEFPAALAGALRELGGDSIEPLISAFERVAEFGGQAAQWLGEVWAEIAPELEPLYTVLSAIVDVIASQLIPFIAELMGSGLIAFIAGVVYGLLELVATISQIVGAAGAAVDAVRGFFDSLYSSALQIFTDMGEGIKSIMDGVVQFFAGIPAQILGFFSGIGEGITNMFRSIKLPHFTFSGSLNPLDWPGGGLPTIGIEWYAKGGIFSRPTVLAGFGDAGAEAAVPLNAQGLRPFRDVIADTFGGGQTNVYIDGARVNDDASIEDLFYLFMRELSALGYMSGGARVGYAV